MTNVSDMEPARLAGDDDRDDTRERILAAALPLFYEKGFKGTSLAAIAKQVGISAPALYWHFSSKRDICFAAVHQELQRFAYALSPALQERGPTQQLGQFVRTYVLLKLGQNERLNAPGALGAYRQLYDALTGRQRAQLDLLQRQIRNLLLAMLETGRQQGVFAYEDKAVASSAIITMCEYVFSWVDPAGRLAAAEIADQYQALIQRMVSAGPVNKV